MAVEDLVDPRRQEPAPGLDERETLEAWLEFHRTTLLMKCEDLDDRARKARPIPTSLLSLHGLVRHMAEIERSSFRRTLHGDTDAPAVFGARGSGDDFAAVDDAVWADDLRAWEDECAFARDVAAAMALGDVGQGSDEPVTLRWVYVAVIAEYARHDGHADLLRELADGAVGW
ncbi:MAG: DinB family protein [Acidimicrobiia bacterium]